MAENAAHNADVLGIRNSSGCRCAIAEEVWIDYLPETRLGQRPDPKINRDFWREP